jgi:hypothetical protein
LLSIWPVQDNPDLDPRGSPGITRRGDHLEFTGTVPWVGRQTIGEHKGRRVSFGDQVPADDTGSWLHYGPDGISKRDASGAKSWTPAQFEKEARALWFNLRLVQDLLIVAVFFFVVSMLLRFKRVDLPAFGPLRVLARCLIPAGFYSGFIAFFGPGFAANLSIGAFLLVLGMNALLFVLGAEPTREEPVAFEV